MPGVFTYRFSPSSRTASQVARFFMIPSLQSGPNRIPQFPCHSWNSDSPQEFSLL